MKKVFDFFLVLLALAVITIIIFPEKSSDFLSTHVFTKQPVAFVQMKDLNDTTKTVRIPMVEDSAYCGGGYLVTKIPADTFGAIVTIYFKESALNGLRPICWFGNDEFVKRGYGIKDVPKASSPCQEK